MLFSSISFLYYFLPALLLAYFVLPRKWRNAVLLLASLVFYAWGEPRFAIIMVSTALTGYLAGLLIDRLTGPRLRRLVMLAGVGLTLLPLLIFKYGDFFIDNLNRLSPGLLAPLKLALPIGVSFYTFQILSYVLDVYKGQVKTEKNPFYFLMYVAFFPQLIAGPIVRFQTIQDQIRDRRVSLDDFAYGVGRFSLGLGKKVLLANNLAEIGLKLSQAGSRTVLSLWLTALAFTLQIYFDFSGYSDMAIGLGRLFGFHFLENFNYPYLSRSVSDFWRRWHMSLGSWFRDYVYIPLGGSRRGTLRTFGNLLIVWLLTGFWHGAAWNFLVWGLFYFALLALERAGLGQRLAKWPPVLSTLYTFILVLLGFVIFNADSMTAAWQNLAGMFGAASLPAADSMALYYARSYAPTLVLAILGATPLPKYLFEKLKGERGDFLYDLVSLMGMVAILVLSTGSLIDGSFNPFLYFRF